MLMSNDSTCTTSVVPTLAPSITASAGTRSTVPAVTNEAAIKPVAVLLCKNRRDEGAREKGAKPIVQRDAEQTAQIGAECAHDAAVDHVQSPEQQRDAAHQVENDRTAHALGSSYQGSE
jgi:hypothetical protein